MGVTAVQLYYSHVFKAVGLPSNASLLSDLWPWFMCAQVLQTVTVISACVPYLRQFLEAFPSGMLQSDEIRRRGLSYADISHGFSLGERKTTGSRSYSLRGKGAGTPHRNKSIGHIYRDGGVGKSVSVADRGSDRTESLDNLYGGDDMVIRACTTLDIIGERREPDKA